MQKKDLISHFGGEPGAGYVFLPGDKRLPLLVAHVDTVHPTPKEILERKQGVLTAAFGLGADDRAGVYAIAQVRQETGCAILLCDEEEVGQLGARKAASELHGIGEYPCLIEVDRRGRGEAVFYNGEPLAFREWVLSFGFREGQGTRSDISVLGPAFHLHGVNISAGFQCEHRHEEYLVVDDLEYSIACLRRMMSPISRHSWL